MTSDTSSSVRTQKKKGRGRQEGRKRRRIELTWPPDLIEELRKRTDNISSFTERVLRAVLFGEMEEIVIARVVPGVHGPGFEPGLTPRKGVVLPLDYPRLKRLAGSLCIYCFWRVKNFEKLFCWCRFCTSHEGGLGCKPR